MTSPHRANANRNIGALADEIDHAICQCEIESNFRVTVGKLAEERKNASLAKADRGIDAQQASRLFTPASDQFLEVVPEEEAKGKYDPTANSAQKLPGRGG